MEKPRKPESIQKAHEPSTLPSVVHPIREANLTFNKPLKQPTPPERRESTLTERLTHVVKLPLESWQLQRFPPGPYKGSCPLIAKPPPATSQSSPTSGLVRLRVPLPYGTPRTPLPEDRK